MKTTLISFSLTRGGAAIAAQKFARLAQGFSEIICYCADNSRIEGLDIVRASKPAQWLHLAKRVLAYLPLLLMRDGNPIKHSLNIFSAAIIRKGIASTESSGSVLNLHWFNNDALSVWRLGRLPMFTVVTLHDEWLYCGSEHYSAVDAKVTEQFVVGYLRLDGDVRGINFNQLIWKMKLRQLQNRTDLIFTVPSNWMLDRARRSTVLRNKDIRLLPNPIETNNFYPLVLSQQMALRKELGVESDETLIAFGAVGGEKNYLKGGHLLREAFRHLRILLDPETLRRVKIALFGGRMVGPMDFEGFSAIGRGRITSVMGMCELYNISDFVVVPSLVESFGQIAAESLACETPVVAFRCSGILDIVQDEVNGFLAKPFDSYDLALRLRQMIDLSAEQRVVMGANGRRRVIEQFSPSVVGKQFEQILKDAASRSVKRDA
jgi:glycosyltransferase involved in cell wall biosynthesis